MDIWKEIKRNGWVTLSHADFSDTVESDKEMSRILPNPDTARQKVITKINELLASAPPSAKFPRIGRMKWLKGSNQRVKEIRITDDFRLIYNVTNPGEITFYCLADHKGVRKHVRDAAARVHNTPMDEYDLTDCHTDEVDISESPEIIAEKEEEIRNKLGELWIEEEILAEERKYHDVVSRCSIYRFGEHGKSLKLVKEQEERVVLPSTMLLPGVAGTGKSTNYHARYFWVSTARNAVDSTYYAKSGMPLSYANGKGGM